MKNFIKNNLFFFINACLLLPLLIINKIPQAAKALCFVNEAYAFLAGKIVSLLPFSILSLLVILLPFAAAALIVFFIKSKNKRKLALNTVAAFMLFISLFILSIGFGYSWQSVYVSLGLDVSTKDGEILESALDYYITKLNESAGGVNFGDNFDLSPDFSFSQLNDILKEEYQRQNYDFLYPYTPKVKAFSPSGILNYLGITGIYAGPLGEANVSANIPNKDLILTAAHELAHSKGVLNEGEANFTAFLLCINSQNAYLRYSGYSYAVANLLSAFRLNADDGRYNEKIAALDAKARSSYKYSNDFYSSYEGLLAEISKIINDAYTKINGMPDGVRTYSLASRGIIGYYIKHYG